jgi:acetylornithine deacetylase/succinyl-diaminopimelate desuccinylase-like protein
VPTDTDVTSEVTDLLQHLIRNACVNDGTAASGQEFRTADLLGTYLEGSGLDLQRFEPTSGRASLVGRIEGSDPSAPSLMLMGHTDVVPVNDPNRWRQDPFGGDLVDGEVWGRGAVDMLNLTASMAVAVRRLAAEGFRPRGTLIYAAIADEEALGSHGADWLLQHERDAVWADYVITEAGGFRLPLPSSGGPKLPVLVGEKGSYWCTLRVAGTPGHASMPLRTDNALVKAAQVVTRLAGHRERAIIDGTWRRFVEGLDLPPDLAAELLDPERIDRFCDTYPDLGVAREFHALTHATIAPTVAHGGVKTNVIPDVVELQVDIRTLPGQTGADIRSMLEEAIGEDLIGSVDIVADADEEATDSPVDTPLWDSMLRATRAIVDDAGLVPTVTTGATDSRFFRRLGVTAYGYGLFSERMSFADYSAMFHGDDERIDQESLRLSTELWDRLARDFLG